MSVVAFTVDTAAPRSKLLGSCIHDCMPSFNRLLVIVLLCVFLPQLFCTEAPTPYATKILINQNVEISLYSPTMFRVRISQILGDKFLAKYEIPFVMGRITNWPAVEYKHRVDNGTDFIETARLQIRVHQADHAWSVWTAGGKTQIYPSNGPVYGMFRDGYTVFDSASALGQRTDYSRYSHWFFDCSTGRYVDTYLGDDLIFDQFFIYGPGYPELFQQLNDLVGPEPMLPKKAYGFFQTQHLGCKGSQAQLLDVASQFRARHIPADTLIVDYEWGDGCPGGDDDDKFWGQLEWSSSYETPLSPTAMIAKLRDMHFDVMLIHHSVPDLPHRAEAVSRDGNRYWASHPYDENYWWKKLKEQLDMGVRGTWQDTRKNDMTDSAIWTWLQNYYGASRRVLFMGNRNMVEVDPWELERDDRAPSNSLLGSRRYPFRWTGDAHTTWSELRWHIDAITNTFGSMAGFSYVTADGYAADWKQQARWNQFLSFSPVARSHTMKPWDQRLEVQWLAPIMAFGEKRDEAARQAESGKADGTQLNSAKTTKTAEDSIRKYLTLRYRLLPYLYSESYRHYRTGFPIARPMVLAFPNNLHVKFNRWPYQYMFGPALLVAPVWADLNTMEIYLPEGYTWVDYWTKTAYAGGQTIVYDTSDAEKLPLFVKSGSIIPMRSDAEWIDPSVPDNPLILDVYPSGEAAAFELYEDDGASTLYQAGQFANTNFTAQINKAGNVKVSLGPTVGNYRGKPDSRTILLEINTISAAPVRVARDGIDVAPKDTLTELDRAPEGWMYDEAQHTVRVKFVQASSGRSTLIVFRQANH